jgi:hypothetical protein
MQQKRSANPRGLISGRAVGATIRAVCVSLGLWSGGWVAAAAEPLDTSLLPHVAGAKTI